MEGRNIEYKRGLWTLEEDRTLMDYIRVHGKGKWNRVSKLTGLKRCGKSCRLRWMNYLSPNVKRGDFSEEEDDLIIRLHNLLGNRWSLIAGRVPGRTDNQVKNHWNTHLSKKLGVSSKRAKTKAPKSATSTSSLERVQGSYCTPPSSEKQSISDGELQQPLPPSSTTSNFSNVNGDYECAAAGFDDEVLMIKDNNVGGAGTFCGMWEAMVGNNNYDISNSSSFWFYNDDLNLYSPCLLDPSLDDHYPLQFEFISNFL